MHGVENNLSYILVHNNLPDIHEIHVHVKAYLEICTWIWNTYLTNPPADEDQGVGQQFVRHDLLPLTPGCGLQQLLSLGFLRTDQVQQKLLRDEKTTYYIYFSQRMLIELTIQNVRYIHISNFTVFYILNMWCKREEHACYNLFWYLMHTFLLTCILVLAMDFKCV